jgi:hypothetical protein
MNLINIIKLTKSKKGDFTVNQLAIMILVILAIAIGIFIIAKFGGSLISSSKNIFKF